MALFRLHRAGPVRCALTAVLLLAAVGVKAADYAAPRALHAQAPVEQIAKTHSPRVAYLPPATEYNFYLAVGRGMAARAVERGVAYQMLAPQIDNPRFQAKLLDELVQARQADLIVLSTHDPQLLAAGINRAVAAGIGVILVNSDSLDFPARVHAVVGYSQRAGTRRLGELYLDGLAGKRATVGLLAGAPGYHSDERVGGFVDAIAGHANIKVLKPVNGNWNVEGGFNAALKLLAANPGIDALFAANDYEAIGAVAAKKLLHRDQVVVLGNDGDPAALPYIADGRIRATVQTDPQSMGRTALDVGLDLLAGRFKGGFVETPTRVVSRADTGRSAPSKGLEEPSSMLVLGEAEKGLNEAGGKGLYIDLLHAIFDKHGVAIATQLVPFARALAQIEHGTADVMLGGFHAGNDALYLPQWHYAVDVVSVAFDRRRQAWSDERALSGRQVGWQRRYDFSNYLYMPLTQVNLTSREGGLKMLLAGRLDFLIDKRSELEPALASIDTGHQITVVDLATTRLYPAFANTPRGRWLAKIYDDELPTLIYSGRLREIYERHGRAYPF